ncbi:Protochlorophyllide reductase, chloroplastic [Auxenochlorella protothecoides]|nr:Protochlorophyllide reductase, chloroplastic [Auxenochlorella protothecoides]KFM25144.1 Protochlorophyllide reductase, chloroplastic [Auxenochlorella protothecoides]RMZ53734.1 hypothetical protein APUTEX25_003873 [Auxenochlorella protothecoides]|eukprot:RMZ53734.1 hypothetical protein APUTEX25_003873 [Auxenochlorella protothecoides]
MVPVVSSGSSISAIHASSRSAAQRQPGQPRHTRLAVRSQAVASPPATRGTSSGSAKLGSKETQKPTAIITGASSGLGLNAAKALAATGDWHVVMAVRDYSKAARMARELGIPRDSYSILHLDLASLDSVRDFVESFRASGRRLDALVANAAVYLPTAKEPTPTADGFELSVGTNHLAHFLLVNLLLEDLKAAPKKSPLPAPRLVIVGSITGNTNTLAGNVPPKADLGDLSGLEAGVKVGQASPMIDGGEFDGAKAYKDSKLCNMLTVRELHRRYHDSTGITFSSLYPGCIASSGLFRSHYGLFKTLFPLFQKYITKGYVSEEEAGKRLAQVISDPALGKSGVYWSWNNDTGAFENEVSGEVADGEKGRRLWEVSERLVGLA